MSVRPQTAGADSPIESCAHIKRETRVNKDNPALDAYRTVLLGSAVQYGSWLPEAVAYVTANQEALARLPVALFSVHIQNLGDDETSRQNRSAYPDRVRPFVRPVNEAFFAGRFDRRGAVLLLPEMIGRFMPTIDYRDWDKIRAWSKQVFPHSSVPPPVSPALHKNA